VLLLLFGCLSGATACPILDTNLIVNGDAELGNTSGWVSTGVEVAPASLAGTLGLPPNVGIGSFSFTGGQGPATSQTLAQTIDLGSCAAEIDRGEVNSTFGILLQSRTLAGATDVARALLSFQDAGGAALASAAFEDTDTPNGVFDWESFTDQRVLPFGTRQISVLLEATRTVGVSSDSFFDNVSLRLTSSGPGGGDPSLAVPEPTTWMLFGLAGAGLWVGRFFTAFAWRPWRLGG
jgi:hypothetical protein